MASSVLAFQRKARGRLRLPFEQTAYIHPQRLVAVGGGRRLNLYCSGSGKPPVILEAGAGGWVGSGGRAGFIAAGNRTAADMLRTKTSGPEFATSPRSDSQDSLLRTAPSGSTLQKGATTRLTAPACGKFESISLQRRVGCELGFCKGASKSPAVALPLPQPGPLDLAPEQAAPRWPNPR